MEERRRDSEDPGEPEHCILANSVVVNPGRVDKPLAQPPVRCVWFKQLPVALDVPNKLEHRTDLQAPGTQHMLKITS